FFEPREPAFFLSFYVCLSSFGFLSSRFFYFSSSFNSCFFCFCYFCFCSFNLLFCGRLCSFYLSSCFSFYCFNFRFSCLFCICSSGLSSFNFCLHRRNRCCSNSLNCSGCSSRCYLSFRSEERRVGKECRSRVGPYQ